MAAAKDQRRDSPISMGNEYFSYNLYEVLRKNEGNIFVSPISTNIMLAIMHVGAGGATADEIERALQLDEPETLYQEYNDLLQSINNLKNSNLNMANQIYFSEVYKIKNFYKTVAEEQFMTGIETIDFDDDSESVRQKINQYVEEKTNNKIKDIVAQGKISQATGIVHISATSFQGNWAKKISPSETKPEPFYFTRKSQQKLPMMHIQSKFNYAEIADLNSQVLEIPYEDEQISMIVFLPKDKGGLSKLEEKLNGKDLDKIFSQLKEKDLHVCFPKFQLQQTIDIKTTLNKMGMETMFTEKADFSGFLEEKSNSRTYEAIQKNYFEVNGEGIEEKKTKKGKTPELVEFKADHPFVFMITQNQYATVLFMGRLSSQEGLES